MPEDKVQRGLAAEEEQDRARDVVRAIEFYLERCDKEDDYKEGIRIVRAAITAAVQAEREACAKICDDLQDEAADREYDDLEKQASGIAAAIRARSNA